MKNNSIDERIKSMIKFNIETLEELLEQYKPYVETKEDKLEYDSRLESLNQLKKLYKETYGK
jgi:hypothetical protein